MSVLAINAGSSSIKFGLFDDGVDESLREGELSWANGNRKQAKLTLRLPQTLEEFSAISIEDDQAAVEYAIQSALGSPAGRACEINVVGHRIVHGGTKFQESLVIDEAVKAAIAGLSKLAPLHHPMALKAIKSIEKSLPGVLQVAVFDTAFYRSLPPKAFIYPLPYRYYKDMGIRRFGFHGISHAYCANRAAELLNHDSSHLSLIICHLGSGCSVTAVCDGAAVATTSGFSPLDGLMMGTRPGSVDPGILISLQRHHKMTVREVEKDLNASSGLLGVSGISPDLGDIERAARQGNKRARLAFEMFADKIRAAIGGLAVTLGRVDALIFTDRLGENSPALRTAVCDGLELLNLRLDSELNKHPSPDADIATADSPGRILVVHCREELVVAQEAVRVGLAPCKTSQQKTRSSYENSIANGVSRNPRFTRNIIGAIPA